MISAWILKACASVLIWLATSVSAVFTATRSAVAACCRILTIYPCASRNEVSNKPLLQSLFRSTSAMFSQLEIKDPQQQAKADSISENDHEISLQEPVNYPGGHTQCERHLSERSPADPVSQHFFSWGKYERVVQTVANRPTAVFIVRK